MVQKIKELTEAVHAISKLMEKVTALIGQITLVVLAAKTLIDLLIR